MVGGGGVAAGGGGLGQGTNGGKGASCTWSPDGQSGLSLVTAHSGKYH